MNDQNDGVVGRRVLRRLFNERAAIVFMALLPFVASAQGPLPPEMAAATMELPPGFKVTLFAGEPAIVQPIAFTFDDRGRVWVIENLSYPTWKADGTGNDRVTILEDVDGDGRHDKRTVFLDKGVNLTGIEVGFGGVWLTSAPNFIFIPDANGDDQPDGPPKVLLDGFTLDAKHNIVGNLAWGPDGWLYGCHGITAPSLVGKPGTPEDKRQKVSCGVWRYHPVRHEFEVYANGTTNPWGIDWDERGELFITNCVIKHIFHVVPGAHFVRMFGQDPNPYVYGLMESCSDHQHWAGGHWSTARGGPTHHDFGGGHAHSGCMIYLGDNWPAEYRGNAFLLNIHGQRMNRDILERQGSGYVAKHATDFAFSKDPWFRGLHAKYGPDGGVYISDWSDWGECHDNKEEQCDKTGGRIYKIVFEQAKSEIDLRRRRSFDLAKASDQELVNFQRSDNQWLVRHARRILQERAAAARLDPKPLGEVRDIVQFIERTDGEKVAGSILNHLWTLHVTGQLDAVTLRKSLGAQEPSVRAQAIMLAVESGEPSEETLKALRFHAQYDLLHHPEYSESALVRLHIASALQRVPLSDRWPIAAALAAHAEDAKDPNLPLMNWYAIEPLVPHDPQKALEMLPEVQIPLVRQYMARRLVAVSEADGGSPAKSTPILESLLSTLSKSSDAVRLDILRGLKEAYRGRRNVAAPASWRTTYTALSESKDSQVRNDADELGVRYGDQLLIALLQECFWRNPRPDLARRRRAAELLATRREPAFLHTLIRLLDDTELRADAIRFLAGYDAAEIPPRLVGLYSTISASERQDVIQTLTARPAFALALLGAIEQGVIPRADVSALTIRQLEALNDKEVSERLVSVWGAIRQTSAERKSRMEQLKSQLAGEKLKSADAVRGRAIFAKSCANCHRLFGEGGRIGPELTGSQRQNLDYALENILDPSAIVPRDYRTHVFRLADGRVVQGMIVEETSRVVAVQTPNEVVRIPVDELENRKESNVSMMPEGLIDSLSLDEIADLVAYLASPGQVGK